MLSYRTSTLGICLSRRVCRTSRAKTAKSFIDTNVLTIVTVSARVYTSFIRSKFRVANTVSVVVPARIRSWGSTCVCETHVSTIHGFRYSLIDLVGACGVLSVRPLRIKSTCSLYVQLLYPSNIIYRNKAQLQPDVERVHSCYSVYSRWA